MADGQVLIDSKLNTSGIERGSKEIKEEFEDLAKVTEKVAEKMEKELDGTGESAEETADSFKTLFKANLGSDLVLDALENMGEAAIDLAKAAVQAAADINASNAQFEQTFKGIEKTARNSLNKISKEVGITATRMQDSYTKIFAFTKSVGADQEQALDISSRALKAAADSAAYYDVSVEEATETLQSFLKGNYENDAALGIAATETTRNAKANELYAKSFNELAEAQKVDVLLAMVEAGNEASGALGQAAREADSWTNVLGELQEAWRLLFGVMGDPLLENLIPVIKGITSNLQELTDAAASMDLLSSLNGYEASLKELDDSFNESVEVIEKNAAMAELYKQRLEKLEAEGFDPASSAAREYSNVVEALNGIYPELNLQIDEATGLLTANSRAQLSNIDTMKKKAIYMAYEEKYSAALKAQAEAVVAVQTAEKQLSEVQTERQALENQLTEATGKTIDDLLKYDAAVNKLTPSQVAMLQQYQALSIEMLKIEQGITNGNAAIAEQDDQLQALEAECTAAAESIGVVAETENNVTAATDEATAAQDELAKKFQETKESARESLESTIGLFQELKFESKVTSEDVMANWRSQQDAFTNYAQNLQTAIDMGLDEALVRQLADGSQQSMEYLQLLVTDAGVSVEEINAQFQNLNQAKDVAATAMAGVKEGIDVELQGVGESISQTLTQAGEGAATAMSDAAGQITVNFTTPVQEEMETLGKTIEETFSNAAETLEESWKGKASWFETNVESPIKTSTENIGSTMLSTLANMETETEAAWNRMVQDVQDAINRMQNAIDGFGRNNVSVNVRATSSNAAASASYTPSAVSAVPVGVPMLATGAVIPPNAPFFAVLGDQKHGTNIEAPLETIKQAVSEVSGSQAINITIRFEGDLAQLGRILQPVIEEETRRIGPSLAEEVIL